MQSAQEYARALEQYDAATKRIPELEREIATLAGRLAEAEAALTREQSRNTTLQTERDAAVARVVEVETGMRGIAAQIVGIANANQPHRNAEVERRIAEARKNVVLLGQDSPKSGEGIDAAGRAQNESTITTSPPEGIVGAEVGRAAA